MSNKLMAAFLTLVVLSATLPAGAAPTCFGRPATIVASNRNPREAAELKGTPGDDVIVGFKGMDEIYAKGGNDLICSGGGDDYIKSGPGDDKVLASEGIDDVWGEGGHDRIWGQRGVAEGLHGDRGNDRLFGGPGTEDYLFGGPGDDFMDGGTGTDLAMYPESSQGITADLETGTVSGDGVDEVAAIETVYGSSFDDVLFGDDGSNILAGGPGNDELHARAGNDLLRSGWGGDDLLDGGGGTDSASYYLGWYPVVANLDRGEADATGLDTLIGITNLVGSKFDDTLIGDSDDNLIQGSRGNDTMDGGRGIDTAAFFDSFEVTVDLVNGTATEERGADTIASFENVIGSGLADSITGDDGPNSIWGGRGGDTLSGAGGDDQLLGERGEDIVDGGDGNDACDGESETGCELDPARFRPAEAMNFRPPLGLEGETSRVCRGGRYGKGAGRASCYRQGSR